MVIETLSIGLIIPAIAFITEEDFFEKYYFIVNFLSNFSLISFETTSTSLSVKKINFIISSLTIILFVYFLKSDNSFTNKSFSNTIYKIVRVKHISQTF